MSDEENPVEEARLKKHTESPTFLKLRHYYEKSPPPYPLTWAPTTNASEVARLKQGQI